MRKLFTILSLVAAPAVFGLNARSAVSVSGLDTNACTPASPCRSFTAAQSATAPGGEIIALTTAGYGPFTITTALTVSGAPGIHAAITSSADGITVAAGGSDHVTLRNLVLIGTAVSGNGIVENSAGELRVLNCLIRGFQASAITTNSGNLTVDHSSIIDNPNHGILIQSATPDTVTTHATITNTLVELSGIGIHCTRGTSSVISDCTLWRNSSNMYLTSLGGASSDKALAVIEKCTFGQGSDGLYMVADGTNISQAFISDTLFDTNTNPLTVASGQAYTYGNNRFLNNSNAPSAMSPVSLQ